MIGSPIGPEDYHEFLSKSKAREVVARMMRSEKQMDESERQIQLLLTLPSDKVHEDEDLEEDATSKRALQLVHCRRLGLKPDNVPSVHVKVCLSKHSLFSSLTLTVSHLGRTIDHCDCRLLSDPWNLSAPNDADLRLRRQRI